MRKAIAIPISRGKNDKNQAKRLGVLACHLFILALGRSTMRLRSRLGASVANHAEFETTTHPKAGRV